MGRGYLVAVTGSMWLLPGLCGCYGVYLWHLIRKITLRGSYWTDLLESVTAA